MPHVVLSGKYDFTRIYIQYKKKINKIEGSTIIKYDDSFINNDKNLLLIKTIVIENQQARSFYIMMVMQKEQQQLTIRLDPLTDPKKINAVKKSLGLIAQELLDKNKDLKVTKTNLNEFIQLFSKIRLFIIIQILIIHILFKSQFQYLMISLLYSNINL